MGKYFIFSTFLCVKVFRSILFGKVFFIMSMLATCHHDYGGQQSHRTRLKLADDSDFSSESLGEVQSHVIKAKRVLKKIIFDVTDLCRFLQFLNCKFFSMLLTS